MVCLDEKRKWEERKWREKKIKRKVYFLFMCLDEENEKKGNESCTKITSISLS